MPDETHTECVDRWTKEASDLLVGRKIVRVRYMTQEECDHLGWNAKGIVIHLDDGNLIYPSRDDEGNDAGALFTNNDELPTIPVIRDYGRGYSLPPMSAPGVAKSAVMPLDALDLRCLPVIRRDEKGNPIGVDWVRPEVWPKEKD